MIYLNRIALLISLIIIASCGKDSLSGAIDDAFFCTIGDTTVLPILTTKAVEGVDFNAASSGGIIISDGGSDIIYKGVVWSKFPNPTIYNNYTIHEDEEDADEKDFTSILSDLDINTEYYVRAYATNASGTAYGNQISFNSGVGIRFHNRAFTDITITLNDDTKTIPPSQYISYNLISGASATFTASTSGKSSSGTQIGLLISWEETIYLDGNNVERHLTVGKDKFFIYIQNSGTANLNRVYVNHGLNTQTLDNVLVPNDGVLYRLGYYNASPNSNVRAYQR